MTKVQQTLLLLTRVIFGMLFLEAGLRKLLSDFSATGYLLNNTSGPLAEIFTAMAGSNLIDFLVIFGEIGIGVALIFGVLVWFASLSGILMMTLYYLSAFPPVNGYISQHIIYILVFLFLWLFHSENYWGFEKQLKQILATMFEGFDEHKRETEE